MAYKINCTPVECVKLRRKHNSDLLDWASEVMAIYGCRPVKGDSDNLRTFVADVFAAGRISGVREERRKRKRNAPALQPILTDLERLSPEDRRLVYVVIYELLRFQEDCQGNHQYSTTPADTQQ